MDELFPADEPFLHQNLAPGAEAVGQFNTGCVRKGSHGTVFFLSVVTLSTDCGQLPARGRNILDRHMRREKNHGIVHAAVSRVCLTLLQKGNDFL